MNGWQLHCFVHLTLGRCGAVWYCTIRCHSAPDKRPSIFHQTISPVQNSRYFQECTWPMYPLQYIHLGLHLHVPLCWHNSTHWKAGTTQQKLSPVLSFYKGTISKVHSFQSQWRYHEKTKLGVASGRAEGWCWAWHLSLEMYGRLALKLAD